MAEHIGDKLPRRFLLGFGRIGVYHIVMTVIACRNVFNGIFEFRIGNDHPFTRVIECRIVVPYARFLIQTGRAHRQIVVVGVEYRAGGFIGRRAEIQAVRAPLLHIREKGDPRILSDDRFFSVIADELSAELFHHRNVVFEIIFVAEVVAAPRDDISVSGDDLFGNFYHVFPRFRIIGFGIETCGAEHFFVDKDAPVRKLERKTVYFTVYRNGIKHFRRIRVDDVRSVFIACGFVVHRSDAAGRDIRIFVVYGKVEHRRTASGGKSRLNELDEFCGTLPRYVDRDVRVSGRKFLNVAVFKFLAVCVLVRPKLNGDGFGLFGTRRRHDRCGGKCAQHHHFLHVFSSVFWKIYIRISILQERKTCNKKLKAFESSAFYKVLKTQPP